MLEPRPIQLVLQGGGARIFALVAALEEIHKACVDGKIKVTRIAGTSAGAIVGSLYAAGIDPQAIRYRFAGFPLDELARFDGLWRKGAAVSRALRGLPLVDDRPIVALLNELFRSKLNPGSGSLLLKDLPTPTLLVASDVSGRRRIKYDSCGERKENDLVSCVMDSCAIPFFFRAAGRDAQTLVLDGGLCENLAAELLVDGVPQYGDVVAISFVEPDPATPRTPQELALSLLDTAISSSVRRAKGLGNLFLIELETFGIGTFDFGRARRALNGHDPAFENARLKTEQRLQELTAASGRARISKGRWESSDPTTMGQLYQIHKSQHRNRKLRYFSRQITVEANSLLHEQERHQDSRDLIIQALEFAPLREPVDCLLVGIFPDEDQRPSDVFCEVIGSEDGAVPFQAVPVKDPDNPHMYGLLIFFTPPLASDTEKDKRYYLRTEFRVGEAFPLLKKGLPDSLQTTIMRAEGTVDRVDLIVHVPKSFGDLSGAPGAPPDVSAQLMSGQVLWPLRRQGDFNVFGWRAVDVPNGSLVQVGLRRVAAGSVGQPRRT